MRNHFSITEASKKIFAKWDTMSSEEFRLMLDEYEKNQPPRCMPDSCTSSCQGNGLVLYM